MIEDALRDFELSTPKQREPEDTPVMEILNGLLNRKSENGSSGSTILRYRTITENFRKVLVDVFGTETLSVGRLRDPNIVDSILNGIRTICLSWRKPLSIGMVGAALYFP
jgi:hypothetical protein